MRQTRRTSRPGTWALTATPSPGETRALTFPCRDHARANGRRRLSTRRLLGERRHGNARHLHVKVDAVEKRAGNTGTVAIEHGRCTPTLIRRVGQPAAHAPLRCLVAISS